MSDITYVGIAEYKLKQGKGELACSALGSCVGVCVRDSETGLTGLLHILLPKADEFSAGSNPKKFADTGVEALVKDMARRGNGVKSLAAKLVGGACLYYNEKPGAALDISRRNVDVARQTLERLGIPILAEHVGGRYARSIRLDPKSFEVRVTILSRGTAVI